MGTNFQLEPGVPNPYNTQSKCANRTGLKVPMFVLEECSVTRVHGKKLEDGAYHDFGADDSPMRVSSQPK